MRILILGAGVIGVTYGWQFSLAGHDVTLLVRDKRKEEIASQGISLSFTDLRSTIPQKGHISYCPKAIITEISSNHGFDLIVVTVRREQLIEVLPVLQKFPGQANVLFFQNNWSGINEISAYLKPEQYLLGFPHMVGGGRDEAGINTIIFGGSSRTMLGEVCGGKTKRLSEIEELMKNSGMAPKLTDNMVEWLITHYIQQSSGIGVFLKYGSPRLVLADRAKIKEMCLVAREGLAVCKARGINPLRISPINMLYLPTFLLTRGFQKMFSDENEMSMVEGHMKHGIQEMIHGFYEVLHDGLGLGVRMPNWQRLKMYVDRYCAQQNISTTDILLASTSVTARESKETAKQ